MKKKKLLLLSDDIRSHSGIATISKEIVLGTVHKYDWVQLGCMINHPELGKIIDISQDVKNISGDETAYVRIYPYNTYGDIQVLRQILELEKPDAILHFTDPHYWIWLYDNEHEIRQKIPILYYHVWDNEPSPEYNRDYYESCDWIGCISKQTYGIVNRVGKSTISTTYKPLQDWQISYVQHGINKNTFRPINEFSDDNVIRTIKNGDYNFILFFNNRNIRRKKPADIIYSYRLFCDNLPKNEADKCLLLMHTTPIDNNGTDLISVKNALCQDYNVLFSTYILNQQQLNELYNLVDCTINISNAEGFGLSTAESLMAGTPIIVNVTGGLQDQCGFKFNNEEFTAEQYIKIKSLHDKNYWDFLAHGEWVVPVWSKTHHLNGSPATPYIYDDDVDTNDVKDAIMKVYKWGKIIRKERGMKGREWMLKNFSSEIMCEKLIEGVEITTNKFVPIQGTDKFNFYKII